MKIRLFIVLAGIALASAVLSAQDSRLTVGHVADAAGLRQEYRQLVNRLLGEFLETRALTSDSIQAYQILVQFAARQDVRLERMPLRTNDERNLGAALAIARLESLGLGYDRIYRLNLRPN